MAATLEANPWANAADILDPPSGLWVPFPKQALASEKAAIADETLFGGAAGPGKTEWGIEYCIRECERYDNNRVGIFRRVFPSLNRTIVPRTKSKLKGRAKWNANEKTFTFENESVLELGTLQYADDVYDYQGAEYGCLFFEEITEFMEEQIDFMVMRLRAPAPGIRPHLISTTNPGGRGHRWVKRRFVSPKNHEDFEGEKPKPLEIWTPLATDENPEPSSRVFVPATLDDNPEILKRDPGYVNRLNQQKNRGLRKAMREGDWDAIDEVEGALWTAHSLDMGRVNPGWRATRQTLRRVVAVDPSDAIKDVGDGTGKARGDAYGVSVCSRGLDGTGYVEGAAEWRAVSVKVLAEKTIDLYHKLNCDAIVIEKNHGGEWLLEVFRNADPYANIIVVWASDNKITRAEPVASLFEIPEDEPDKMPKARLVGFHDELEEELTTFTGKPGDPSPNQLDAMVWAMTDLLIGRRVVSGGRAKDRRSRGRR